MPGRHHHSLHANPGASMWVRAVLKGVDVRPKFLGVPSVSILSRDPNLSGNRQTPRLETDPVIEKNDG